MIVNGVIDNEERVLSSRDFSEVVSLWFAKIDNLYFLNENIVVVLSDFDKIVVSNFPECCDKLKVLGFKKNVVIKGF